MVNLVKVDTPLYYDTLYDIRSPYYKSLPTVAFEFIISVIVLIILVVFIIIGIYKAIKGESNIIADIILGK